MPYIGRVQVSQTATLYLPLLGVQYCCCLERDHCCIQRTGFHFFFSLGQWSHIFSKWFCFSNFVNQARHLGQDTIHQQRADKDSLAGLEHQHLLSQKNLFCSWAWSIATVENVRRDFLTTKSALWRTRISHQGRAASLTPCLVVGSAPI